MRPEVLLGIVLATGHAVGCTYAVDPCPPGMRASRSADRCVAMDAETEPTDRLDAETPLDAAADGAPDRGTQADAELAPGQDAGFDLDSGESDSGGTEDTDAATPDAGTLDASADSAAPAACSADDQAAWADFHLSGELVPTIRACITANPSCLLGTCPLDRCLRETLGLTACEACVETEVRCVATHCMDACGKNDEQCRACACHHGCVDLFGSCAGEPLDACSDCSETTCVNMSVLPPELIMVVVSPLL